MAGAVTAGPAGQESSGRAEGHKRERLGRAPHGADLTPSRPPTGPDGKGKLPLFTPLGWPLTEFRATC